MKAKQTVSLWTVLILLVAGGFALTGCTGADGSTGEEEVQAEQATNASDADKENADKKKKGKDGEEKPKEEAVPVEVSELAQGSIESVLAFSANLEAESSVTVVAEATRQVTELLVEEGDRVRRGQVLLRLQDDEQKSALAKVVSQVEKAEREFARQERLYKQELISEETYNNAAYELEQLRLSQADAERELGYTEVRAPISGTVTARQVNLGDQVQINQALFELVDFDSIVARIYVPEKHIGELRNGLPANVAAQTVSGTGFACSVKRIAPIVDPKSGTVKVTVAVGARQGLRPGMYVDVNLITATHDEAVLVPKRAVVYDDDQAYVYRMKGTDRVERVFIEPLLSDKHHIEPVSGLAAGDRVVVAGQAALKEGALVKLPGNETDAHAAPAEENDQVVARASL